MLTRDQKIDATKDAILRLLESKGPQSIVQIVAEVKEQAYLGLMAYALSGLQFDCSIYWNEDEQAYDVM